MRRRRYLQTSLVVLLVGFIVLIHAALSQASPRQINYKGLLKDSLNNPLTGTYYVEFRIYNLVTGGTLSFCEVQSLTITSGKVEAHIGAATTGGIPDGVFLPPDNRYLEVAVGTSLSGPSCPYPSLETLAPRVELTAAAWVYHAKKSDSSDTCTTCSNANLLDGYDSIDFSSSVHTHNYDSIYVNEGQVNSITTTMIVNGTIGADDLGINVVGSVDGVTPATKGGNIDLIAGSGITITPNDGADTITIASTATGGDISGVNAGTGLTGGGPSGDVTLTLGTSYQLPQLCSNGQTAEWNGTAWVCAADNDVLGGLTCANGQVAKWNGMAWACAADVDTNTLGGLSCATGQIAQWNGTAWACVSPSGVADTRCEALGTCATVFGGPNLSGMTTTGFGVTGTTSSTTGGNAGTYGFTNSPSQEVYGMYGVNNGGGYGVVGITFSSNPGVSAMRGNNFGAGYGLEGSTTSLNANSSGLVGSNYGNGHGIFGVTQSTLSSAVGIFGTNYGPGYGISANSVQGPGLYVKGGNGRAIDAIGDIVASGHIYANTSTFIGDIAEPVLAVSGVEAGDVVAIGSLSGDFESVRFEKASTPYDKRVAGVISTNPSMILANDKDRLPLAVNGIVPVKVDTAYGEIHPGDLLTSSPEPGYAMKVSDHSKAQGAIIGKALETLREGQGKIMVLVTLQ